jgi:hypothetical protein
MREEEAVDVTSSKTKSGKGYHYWWNDDDDKTAQVDREHKLLTQEESVELERELKRATKGGSLWNSAGTFEEKDYLKWAKQEMNTIFRETAEDVERTLAKNFVVSMNDEEKSTYAIRRGALMIECTNLSGNCSIVNTRGKARHGMDLDNCEFKFCVTYQKGFDGLDEPGEFQRVMGTFLVNEISIDAIRDDEIEISDFKMSDPKEKEFAHLKERTKTFFLEWKRQLLNETFIKLEQMLAEKAKANE